LPGILAGMILSFARALGEFGATITFVSNIPGETQTLPTAIYMLIQVPGGDLAALRLTLVSIVISMLALFASEALIERATRRGQAGEVEHVIYLLGIAELLARRPANLSGGEKQRVAIGRALLAQPRLLVMDEPLASLDEARKTEILPYIERLRDEFAIPIVYVSHAIAEVTRLATTMVVIPEGRVAASGRTCENI